MEVVSRTYARPSFLGIGSAPGLVSFLGSLKHLLEQCHIQPFSKFSPNFFFDSHEFESARLMKCQGGLVARHYPGHARMKSMLGGQGQYRDQKSFSDPLFSIVGIYIYRVFDCRRVARARPVRGKTGESANISVDFGNNSWIDSRVLGYPVSLFCV